MWKALLSKELRECSLYAGLAFLAQLHFLGEGMGLPLLAIFSNGRQQEIPFLGESRGAAFIVIAILIGTVLGLQQTVWESWRQTTLFLLHRPMARDRIFLAKLVAGAALLMGVTAGPLLVYSLWAATPGTHASPFYWGMTEPWWRSVAVGLVCYLGAFLSGLRPAHWLGSRTWPWLAAVTLSVALKYGTVAIPLIYLGFLALAALFGSSILETARRREYP